METSVTDQNSMSSDSSTSVWRMPLAVLGLMLIFLLGLYYPTTISFVQIWNSSDTFAHGYLILPISLWLIWRNRDHFTHLQPRVNYYAIPLTLLASFGWLVAYYVDVQVIQQLALVSMILFLVLGIMGWQVFKTAIFPLAFLFFAVPMGEGLVPILIEFTADFTVAMVQMTGIPIYREGTFFQLPTGNWSVVEACSGVRYLIASVTLGVLYAYLTYQSTYRRVAFIAVAIIVPIIANGLRAFLIVMIGHFSDMELATGVDHLVYGWFFFGIVIAIMFYIGSFWQEDEKAIKLDQRTIEVDQIDTRKFMLMSAIVFVSVSLLPLKAYTDHVDIPNSSIVIGVPSSIDWRPTENRITNWTPRYQNMDASLIQQYENEGSKVDIFVGYYAAQRENSQLITSSNVIITEKDDWKKIGQQVVLIPTIQGAEAVPVAHLKDGKTELLVAYFYYFDKQILTNDYLVKLYEAKNRIIGGSQASSIIAISTELKVDKKQALQRLSRFMKEMNDAIFIELDQLSVR